MFEFLGAIFNFFIECIFASIGDILYAIFNRIFGWDKKKDNDKIDE
jgi:hypothetical protein